MFQKIPQPVKFLLLCFFTFIFFFFDFRLLLYLEHPELSKSIPGEYILQSFILGFRFDTVVICYLLLLPLALFFLFSITGKNFRWLNKIIFIFIFLGFAIYFLVTSADLPWFEHQQKRITVSALQWTNTPGMMTRIVFEDLYNYKYIVLFLVTILLFYFLLKKIKRLTIDKVNNNTNLLFSSLVYLFTGLLILVGIRGRITFKSPIRWGTAFVSEYDFSNQLGLNPVYTLGKSWIEKNNSSNHSFNSMDDSTATTLMRNFYDTNGNNSASPILRNVFPSGAPRRLNVILVLMEGMSAYNMEAFGNNEKLTPVLDSLFRNSLSFSDFYSDGIHTSNGIYSSLFGMPSIPGRHPMQEIDINHKLQSLPAELHKKNYRIMFFTSHDEQFDNMSGFLRPNGFDKIFGQKDYDDKDVLNILGVPDHVLFREAVKHLDEANNGDQNFFATVLTSSNHGPYEIPPGISFVPHSTDVKKQLIEYADWSIGEFIKSCRGQKWFDQTIFIFTGDHGAIIGDMDMYLTYHHVPLIIFSPKNFSPEIKRELGGQTDIFPTVMGLLNLSYVNQSFGIDLLREKRNFITFSYDDEFGAFSPNDFYVNRQKNSSLFLINREARFCKPIENELRADSMLNYARAVFQTQQMLSEGHFTK